MDGTVLVADDDRTIRTVLTQALTRAGCRVHATSSLVTLMRWVEEGRGDVVDEQVDLGLADLLEVLVVIRASHGSGAEHSVLLPERVVLVPLRLPGGQPLVQHDSHDARRPGQRPAGPQGHAGTEG